MLAVLLRRNFLRQSQARLFVALLALLFCIFTLSNAHAASSWTKQKSNTLAWLHAVYFLDANKGWVVGGSGVLLTTDDGGASWRALRRPTEDALRDVYFSDEDQGWLVCERSIYQLKTNDEPRTYLLHTTTGGATWQRVNVIGAKDASDRLVRAVFAEKGMRGWVFGEEGALYATRDGGASWFRQSVPTRHLLLGGAFLNADQGWLVGAGATILQTSDGGDTWHTATLLDKTSERLNAASFADDSHGWAVGAAGRILFTTNGGKTWRTQTSGVNTDLYDVKFINYAEGWAIGAEGVVLHTMNGGARWILEQSGTTHPLERLSVVDRTHVQAVGFGGTIIAYDAADNKSPRQSVPQIRPRTVH